MNRKTLGLPLVCAALATLALARPQEPAAGESFDLAGAVPEDVFLFSHTRHNPERAFLDAYWGEVWETFQASGIVGDLTGLVMGAVDEERRAVMQRLHERFGGLIADIDWSGLVGGEVAFGERMPPLQFMPRGGAVAMPEYVVVFRPAQGADVDAIHAGIQTLVEALVEEVRTLAGVELSLESGDERGVRTLSLDLEQMAPDAPSIPFTLGRRGGMLFLSVGKRMQADVVSLLTGSPAVRSIGKSERLRAAMARLPAHEDELVWFDMQVLRSNLNVLLRDAFERVAADVPDSILNSGGNAEALALRRQGFDVYQNGNYAEAMRLMTASLEIDPTDATTLYNIACLLALMGDPQAALEGLEKSVEAGFHAPGKIASDDDLATLRKEPRFVAALERARALAGQGKLEELAGVKRLVARLLDTMGIMDGALTVTSTEGHSTYSESLSLLAQGAETNAFYPVLAGGGAQIADFAHWLPRETTAFTVDAGISLQSLYAFVEDSVRQLGPVGEEAWKKWEEAQLEMDFDLREDLLSWVGQSSVQASLDLEGGEGWMLLMQVNSDEAASEGLEWALELIPEKISELAAEIPPLAMLQMRVAPTQHPELEGFHDVALGMMPAPMVMGVRDGWMMMGSSQEALLATLHTATGQHENVRANEALMAKLLEPDGPVQSMSFTDHSGDAQEAAAILGAVTMGGGMVVAQIPDPEQRQVAMQLLRILGKLGPVIAKIDFYDSSASYTRFDGKAWHTRSVTHYVPPAKDEGAAEGGQ